MQTISYQTGGSVPPKGPFLQLQIGLYEKILEEFGHWFYENPAIGNPDPKVQKKVIALGIKSPDKETRKRALETLVRTIDGTVITLSRQLIDALLHHLTAFDGDRRVISWGSLQRAMSVLASENRIAEQCPEFGEKVLKPLQKARTEKLLSLGVMVLIKGDFFTTPVSFVTTSTTGRTRCYLIQRTADGIVITAQVAN